MGVLADRTKTRWGKFRPWVIWTAIPWAVVMVLAYTTPKGWSYAAMLAYAAITNTLLMTLYSMNNMPYSALGGVMTADLDERARLNSYRFVAVNIAQFIVGGFTLPLVAKFAVGHDRAHGWQMTMTIWAVLCFVLFLITFATTRERIQPVVETKSSPKQDFADLLKNGPWRIMAADDARSLRHPLVPRRRALQLLPLLRGQGGDVRLRGETRTHRRRAGAGRD
jgi:glycoside/pentoside/hexuronide:cation symporter, GPH family